MHRVRKLTLLLVSLLALAGAGMQHHELLRERSAYHLGRAAPDRDDPPWITFATVALGGFRGLLADILWLRASDLQEDHRYFELVQLADWITKLQPQFSDVWAFHAWNMAYNVSFAFPEPADRWRWINNGIRLLRDEGIALNPNDAKLYVELAWIYQHKVGGASDRFNLYYKEQFASTYGDLLGDSPDSQLANLQRREIVNDLRRNHGLDAAEMNRVSRRYDGLDWRVPFSHAVYWAQRGFEKTDERNAPMAERMLYQALRESMRQGRLIHDAAHGVYLCAPNVRPIAAIDQLYQWSLRTHHREMDRRFYESFLREASVLLFVSSRDVAARRLFETFQLVTEDRGTPRTYESFLYDSYLNSADESAPRRVPERLRDCYLQHYFWSTIGDPAFANGYERLAALLAKEYSARAATEAASYPPLPDLALMRAAAKRDVTNSVPASFRIRWDR